MKMKTLIFLALIFSISTVWAKGPKHDDDNHESQGCNINTIFFDIQSVLQVDCLKPGQSNKERCKCLEETAKDNYLVNEILNKKGDDATIIADREKAKLKLTNQFMDVYSQMTVEAGAQTEILNMGKKNNDELIVGCPANEISTKVKEETQKALDSQTAALKELLKDTEDELKKCNKKNIFGGQFLVKKRDCPTLQQQVDRIKDQLNASKPTEHSCKDTIALLKSDAFRKALPVLKEKATPAQKAGFEVLEKMIETDNISSEQIGQMMAMVNGVSSMWGTLTGIKKDSPCKMFFQVVNANVKQVLNKSGRAEKKPRCSSDDDFCNTLDNLNQVLQQKYAEKFSHDAAKDCVSFAEFKTYKSMPSAQLLSEMGSSSRKARISLDIPHEDDPLYAEKISFIRRNPLLGKLAANKNYKKRMGEALNKLSTSLPANATEPQKMRAYLDFMQGPVKNMLDEPEMKQNEQFVCKTMVDNFTAIQVAQDIPGMNEKDDQTDNMALLFKGVRVCRALDYNKSTISNLDATLKASPIFMRGTQDAQNEEKTLDDEFVKYKAEHCGDYAAAVASCEDKSPIGLEECRQKYLGKSNFSVVNTVMRAAKVGKELTGDMMERIADFTNPDRQDNGYKEHWYNTIGANMPGVLAGRGKEAEYAKQYTAYSDNAADSKVPAQFHHSKAPSAHTASTTSGSTTTSRSPASNTESSEVNEGQQRPAFLNPAPQQVSDVPAPVTFNPEKVANATSVEEINPQFAQMNPENKVKYLDQLQNFTSSLADADAVNKRLKLNEELEEATDELNELKKENKEDNKVAAKPVSKPVTSVSQPLPANAAGMYPILSSAGGSSSATRVKLDPSKKKSSAVNDALNSINEQRSADGRDVSSISGELQVVIQATEADVKSLQGPFKVEDEISAGTHENYLAISQDANKLAEFIAKTMNTAKVKDASIISIQDPGTGDNLLFKVNKKGSKSFSLESWPLNAKVERRFKLDHLNNTIKQ